MADKPVDEFADVKADAERLTLKRMKMVTAPDATRSEKPLTQIVESAPSTDKGKKVSE